MVAFSEEVSRISQKNMILLLLKLLLVTAVCCAPGKGTDLDLPPVASERLLQGWIGPEALLFRLDKLLDVCIANYEDLSTDLLLGVAIANGKKDSRRKWCEVIATRIMQRLIW